MASTIIRVEPLNIPAVWHRIVGLVEPVVALTGTHTCDDVRNMLMTQSAQLWVEFDGVELPFFLVSHFVSYPEGLALRLWLAGGPGADLRRWHEHMRAWAKHCGCRWLEVEGRMGWGKFDKSADRQVSFRSTLS